LKHNAVLRWSDLVVGSLQDQVLGVSRGRPPRLKWRRLCSCLFYGTGLWITRSVQDFPHSIGIRLIGHEILHLGEDFRFRRRRVEYDLQRAEMMDLAGVVSAGGFTIA